jgi:hypothetical protein
MCSIDGRVAHHLWWKYHHGTIPPYAATRLEIKGSDNDRPGIILAESP